MERNCPGRCENTVKPAVKVLVRCGGRHSPVGRSMGMINKMLAWLSRWERRMSLSECADMVGCTWGPLLRARRESPSWLGGIDPIHTWWSPRLSDVWEE